MNRLIFLFTIAFSFLHCSQDKPATGSPQTNTPVTTAPPATTQAAGATLPSISLDLVKKLWSECDHVDYIFYDLPMSMSLDEKPSIQQSVRHIAEAPAPMKPNCKPVGRVTYLIKGNITLEGDFYFSDGCTYFVFVEKGKKTHSNLMTDEGIQYFKMQIQQGMKMQQQVQQQQSTGN